MTLVRQLNPNQESGGVQPYQQNRIYDIEGVSPCISAEMQGRGHIVQVAGQQSQTSRIYDPAGIAPTQSRGSDSSGTSVPIVVTRSRGFNKGGESQTVGTITGKSFEHNHHIKLTELTHNVSDAFRIIDAEGLARTLKAEAGGGGAKMGNYKVGNRYRRLTEIECERLQGFPDDWTKWGNYDGIVKEVPKTHRYRMCGNAVTRDIIELIGKRLINHIETTTP